MSLYGTYIEGLESTPPAPFAAANSAALLPATDSTQREAGIKIELQPGLLIQAAYFNIERGSAFVDGANVYVLDGRARFRGTELSLTGELTPDWSIYATSQLLNAKQISGADTLITRSCARETSRSRCWLSNGCRQPSLPDASSHQSRHRQLSFRR